MKQALIVDPENTVEDFALSALGLYERTVAGSLQEAEALVSGADFDLVLIARPEGICVDATWAMVERIMRSAVGVGCFLVHTVEADVAFHTMANRLGVSVVTAPAEVAISAPIDELTVG